MNPADQPPIHYHSRTIFDNYPAFAEIDAKLIEYGVKAEYLEHGNSRCYRIRVKELSKLPKRFSGYWLPISGHLMGWTFYPVPDDWFDEYYQNGWAKRWKKVKPPSQKKGKKSDGN